MLRPRSPEQQVENTLRRQRPAPSHQFAYGLRERLTTLEWQPHRPARLWLLVAAYTCCGIVLLLLAAIGISGGGPFGS